MLAMLTIISTTAFIAVMQYQSNNRTVTSKQAISVQKNLTSHLYKVIIIRDRKVIRRRRKICQPWRYADEEESENQPINDSHLISLLSVESKRVYNLLSANNYIDRTEA